MSIVIPQFATGPGLSASTILDALEERVTGAASFVVLPESAFSDRAEPLPSATRDEVLERLNALARRRSTYVLTGSWIEESEAQGAHHVARLIDPDGNERTAVERGLLPNGGAAPGDDFPVVETEYGTVGVLLGSDFWLVEPPRLQCLAGAELLLVAGSLGGKFPDAQRAAVWGIATINTVAIAFASALSTRSRGCSSVATPERFLAEIGQDEGILESDWDLGEQIRFLREPDLRFQQTLWFGLWARRPDLYEPLVHSSPTETGQES